MAATFSGGCLCGAVRYSIEAEPVFSGNCHCKDCQRSSGGPYTPAMMFPEPAVKITGTPTFFKSRADSGRDIERGFCPACGSQMFVRLQMMPGILGVKAGSLDDASTFEPSTDFYVTSAAPWDLMDPRRKKHDRSPAG